VSTTLARTAERSTRIAAGESRNHLADLAACGVIAVCALLLHRDGLFGGPAFYELDTRLFYFPLAHWVGDQLQAGHFPLWLPGIFTGYPIFADGELGLAYVPQLALLALLPAHLAMVWLRVLHVFLAGVFTYVYLRALRLDTLPSLGGGLVFAFGSFLTAQMHHENVVRSAVWLPAVLACIDRAVQQPPPFRRGRFVTWTAVGALAFAQSALGLHIQPVLMAALALGLYALFRALAPARGVRSAYWPVGGGAAIVGGGLALAAVQWLPLGEWALVSTRRGGVDYTFASAFALAPATLLSVVFPYFFRLSDATTWWSLWQQWETELYVGVPTLALVVVGVVMTRRIEIVYFVLLGLISLWIGMAEYAPFNLHEVLWTIPGFSFLRAPGRFTYLIVFACACLAAFGLQALRQRRLRMLVALVGAAPPIALLAAFLALLPTWRNWLLADPVRATTWVQSAYLSARAQYPIDPQLALTGFLTSLDISNVKTAWSLTLLGLTSLAFVAWLALGPRRTELGQGLFVGLVALDLLVFAFDFHPRTPLTELTPALDAPPGQRVLMHDPADLPGSEPNQLLAAGIPTAEGYSSLPSQRHVELDTSTSTDPRLIDVWSAPLVLEPPNPADLREVNGVRFRAAHPLAAGFGGSSTQTYRLPTGIGPIVSVRVIGTLSYAYKAPQGETVATIGIGHQTLPIRAGIESSERAYDRPSLAGLVQHQKAAAALDFEETTPEGEDYMAHLYQADIVLPTAVSVDSLSITPIDPSVRVELYGIAPIDALGGVHSLDLANRDGMQRVTDGMLENSRALPRAYTLPMSQAFSPARHPGLTTTQLVDSPDVDLHTMVLIENDPDAPAAPTGSVSAVAATQVEDLGPNAVRVTATADSPSYLVLADFYHRGWTAHVDGQPAKVFIANALFRAVAIGPGSHVVEFRFEPLSHLVGAAISAVSLVVVCVAIAKRGFQPER
jgi:Bacterial membrane protein YfhO